jgi:hypothetical protein
MKLAIFSWLSIFFLKVLPGATIEVIQRTSFQKTSFHEIDGRLHPQTFRMLKFDYD